MPVAATGEIDPLKAGSGEVPRGQAWDTGAELCYPGEIRSEGQRCSEDERGSNVHTCPP